MRWASSLVGAGRSGLQYPEAAATVGCSAAGVALRAVYEKAKGRALDGAGLDLWSGDRTMAFVLMRDHLSNTCLGHLTL